MWIAIILACLRAFTELLTGQQCEDIINKGRTAMTALPDFMPLQGGVPIEIDGTIVGGIGVSGASSAQQDEEIAIAGANAAKDLKAAPVAAASDISYFDKDQVSAAFAKGSVLFDGGGTNYMVHASRRETPGQVEVHSATPTSSTSSTARRPSSPAARWWTARTSPPTRCAARP